MDILYIVENANLRGGTEILTFILMNALRKCGQDCKILSIEPYLGKDENVISLSVDEYRKWRKSANSLMNKLLFYKYSDSILQNILRKKYKELYLKVIINQTYDLITALPTDLNIAQVFNWSVCGYEKSLLYNIKKKEFFTRLLSSYINYGIRKRRHKVLCKIPKLIVLSEAAKKEITSLNLHVNDDQLLVIPDPLFVSKDSEQISSLKNKNVIFVGRLSQEKGVMRLLRIWQTVCKSLDGYNLYIYGEGNAIDEMQQYIKDNKLDNNVVFKGYCQDISQIYLNADLLCMTSDTEGFGMVLIESMYYGVPCISFDCPTSPKEIINNAGVVVPCFDEEKYAYEIVSLLSNSDRMKSLQQNGIKRARHFYINKIVARWIEVCKE